MNTSCSEDDEPVYAMPQLSLSGDDYMEVRIGEPIVVTLEVNMEGGNGELLVFSGGGLLDRVALPSEASTFIYDEQQVPETATEGQEFEYEFSVINSQSTESGRVNLTVSTIAYEPTVLGGETLYRITVPQDGIVESDVVLVSGRKYWIEASLDFQPGTTLTVQPGTELYLKAGNEPLTDIIIRPGATVDMAGTAENPITISSDNTLTGEALPGDWGLFNIRGDGAGSNSGSIAFVRMEYGGVRNFRLQNVGEQTIINHVQVFKASGEGIMITDGNVNLSHIVATDCASGGFRLGDAYAGQMQFGISILSERFDDNSEVDIRETSSAILANFSVIGPGADAGNTSGIRMRGASSGKVYNSIIADFPRRGLRLNDNIEITNINGPTVFAHSFIFNVPNDPYRDDTGAGNPFRGYVDTNGVYQNPFFNNVSGMENGAPILTAIEGIGNGSIIPSAVQSSAFDPSSIGGFFTSAPYVGAIRDAGNDWTKGWVKNPDGSIR
ncbi:hypothetical protein [Anditalea andensis]|uniref:Right handed beta helix domain-containing protein n=1 Tax=Anditalea andensis TaxID=1048983 RepID=A0A074L582_9BACT|nr:hypothetical protein [Anditalea andensis]KEO75600.1 hypothetical protein EL17_00465 [Anditalea andensis]